MLASSSEHKQIKNNIYRRQRYCCSLPMEMKNVTRSTTKIMDDALICYFTRVLNLKFVTVLFVYKIRYWLFARLGHSLESLIRPLISTLVLYMSLQI
jgi:hypothetical protein